jgi:hypothetical protein
MNHVVSLNEIVTAFNEKYVVNINIRNYYRIEQYYTMLKVVVIK